MVCPSCYSEHLRLSKFRSEDVGQLFVLRYPVRCRTCGERSYGNLFRAMRLPHSHTHRTTAKDGKEAKEKANLQ
jgi:hypothetical protein